MSAVQTYPGQPVVEETSYTAIIALIIAIVAIILIIVVVYLVSVNQAVIVDTAAVWTVLVGTGTSGTFAGAPNHIFQTPTTTSTTASYSITVNAYTDIASFVATGSKTTVFKIDNSLSLSTANIVSAGTGAILPSDGGTASPQTIPARSVYEYEWTSSTTYKLIGWSKA